MGSPVIFKGDSAKNLAKGYEADQATTIATPQAGARKIFAKVDGWYEKDDAGVERKFSTSNFGFADTWTQANGASKSIAHGLGTTDINVSVFDIATGETVLVDTIVRTSINAITLTASVAPPATNWRVLILSLGGVFGGGGGATGDVVGPASSTNNGFAKFDGVTGKLLKSSPATVVVADGGTGATTASAARTNLNVRDAGDAAFTDSRTPNGAAGGDLAGSYPNPTVNTITPNKGGTGLTAVGSALQVLRMNAAANGLEYAAPSTAKRTVFTSSGTWTKLSTTKVIRVEVLGGGGGGGSGRRGLTAVVRSGGGGGASGAYSLAFYTATDLAASETITVGAGGSGGAAIAVDTTNGNAGANGGNSVFSSGMTIAVARGGGGGGAGSAAAAAGGAAPLGTTPGVVGGGSSATGGAGTAGTQATGSGAASGAGGAGIPTGNTASAGGAGGAVGGAQSETNTGGGAAGSTAGTAGGAGTSNTTKYMGGGGGGGGGSNATTVFGNGGAGGAYGGGGGGGSASLNGVNSGAGGNGGVGVIVITEW